MPDTHLGRQNTGAVWPGGASKQGPHRVGAFSICPQLEAFGYELNLRPSIEKEATKIGTLVHVGLAYRYGTQLATAHKPSWLVYQDGRYAIWICGQDRPDLAQEALRIYDAYCAHWDPLIASGVAPAFRPLLIEHQFEVGFTMPDGSSEPYTARIDLLAEVVLPTGREVWLIDHKTGSKLTNHTGTSYRADRQMLTGLALCRAHGFNVNRVIINAMSREYPQPRFARFEVPISHEAYSRLGADTAYVLQQMNDVRKRYPDPNNRPRSWDSCLRKYGRCDFWDVCTNGQQELIQYVKRT
jgi:hypothetical protein